MVPARVVARRTIKHRGVAPVHSRAAPGAQARDGGFADDRDRVPEGASLRKMPRTPNAAVAVSPRLNHHPERGTGFTPGARRSGGKLGQPQPGLIAPRRGPKPSSPGWDAL